MAFGSKHGWAGYPLPLGDDGFPDYQHGIDIDGDRMLG